MGRMKKFAAIFLVLAFACVGQASWYWPFGSSDENPSAPRLSELMEQASLWIDEASDLAESGKADEAVEKYRAVLDELDRIERENPERAKTAEFATIRNKRAYVNAAIDSMLLSQVKANAKAVAVSDTTDLEKKLAAERAAKDGAKAKPAEEPEAKAASEEPAKPVAEEPAKPVAEEPAKAVAGESAKPVAPARRAKALTKREQAMADIAAGDFAAAEILVNEMLAAKPNGAMALNLKATLEAKQGRLKEAEDTLDRAIVSNPRSHFAYYNMALLMLQKNPDNKVSARRYYETGRAMGGPKDVAMEEMLK